MSTTTRARQPCQAVTEHADVTAREDLVIAVLQEDELRQPIVKEQVDGRCLSPMVRQTVTATVAGSTISSARAAAPVSKRSSRSWPSSSSAQSASATPSTKCQQSKTTDLRGRLTSTHPPIRACPEPLLKELRGFHAPVGAANPGDHVFGLLDRNGAHTRASFAPAISVPRRGRGSRRKSRAVAATPRPRAAPARRSARAAARGSARAGWQSRRRCRAARPVAEQAEPEHRLAFSPAGEDIADLGRDDSGESHRGGARVERPARRHRQPGSPARQPVDEEEASRAKAPPPPHPGTRTRAAIAGPGAAARCAAAVAGP